MKNLIVVASLGLGGCVTAMDMPDYGTSFTPHISAAGEHRFIMTMHKTTPEIYGGDEQIAQDTMLATHMASHKFCLSGYRVTNKYIVGDSIVIEGECKN